MQEDDNNIDDNTDNTAEYDDFSEYSDLELRKMLGIYKALLKDFSNWLNAVPVLAFNAKKYDFHLARKILPEALDLTERKDTFIIKKGNNFSAICTSKFKFLDLTNYITPGYSYAKFLEAYGVEELRKFWFSYEWFTSPGTVSYTHLTLPTKRIV